MSILTQIYSVRCESPNLAWAYLLVLSRFCDQEGFLRVLFCNYLDQRPLLYLVVGLQLVQNPQFLQLTIGHSKAFHYVFERSRTRHRFDTNTIRFTVKFIRVVEVTKILPNITERR